MISMYMLILLMLMMKLMKNMNPIKVSVALMLMSAITFLTLSAKTGVTWFPLIMFLLFMGGILVMFMILSSLMPNQSLKKYQMKNKMEILIMIAMISIFMFYSMHSYEAVELKKFMASSTSFMMLTSLMVIYFLIFMKIVGKEKTPMRENFCYKKKIFVNFKEKSSNKI